MPRVSAALTPILARASRSAIPAALAVLSALATAQVPGAASRPAAATPDPAGWLRLMGRAARQTNYDGIVMIQAAGQASSVEVSHRFDGVSQFERLAPLDGPERQIFRRDDEVRVLWPQARTAVLQHRAMGTEAPWSQANERVLDWYQVSILGQQRWAGHPAIVLQLQPRDEYRFGQRVWAERRSGLVLRADTLTAQGQVLEWTGFLQVALDPAGGKRLAMPEAGALAGWRVLQGGVHRATLDGEGWSVQALPPGFRLLGCVRRPATPAAANGETALPSAVSSSAQEAAANGNVLQAVFSDGVAHVSVFIEPFDPKRHSREMQLGRGATQTLKRRVDAWWLTVVGDVPAPTVQRFAAAFRRR